MDLDRRASAAGRKHAVVVGINSYPHFAPKLQLRGCVNDVRAMAKLLEDRFGFAAGSIVQLEDGAATQAAIRGVLEDLGRHTGRGDVVVFFYSGHGSRVRDPLRPSGWAEVIVPADSGRDPHPNRDIPDSWIHDWLLALAEKACHIALIFDSCFSGGIASPRRDSRGRFVPADPRPLPGRRVHKREIGPSGWLPPGRRYVLLAGSRADQISYELPSEPRWPVPHGAMTFFLREELEQARPDDTYRKVFTAAARKVTKVFPTQWPQLEGARDCRIFDSDAGQEPTACVPGPVNGDPGSRLAGLVQMVLKRRRRDGTWNVAEMDAAGEPPVFEEGDRVAVEISHCHEAPLFVSLLDFGLSGRVSLLFPEPGGFQRLLPGRTLALGLGDREILELSIPDGFARASGREHFNVIATTGEADFSLLADQPDALSRILSAAGDWTAVTRTFELRRRS